MTGIEQSRRPDEAFDRIEQAILPSLSILLDQLVESGREDPGSSPAQRAAELRMMALQLDTLVGEMNVLSLRQTAPRLQVEASAA